MEIPQSAQKPECQIPAGWFEMGIVHIPRDMGVGKGAEMGAGLLG